MGRTTHPSLALRSTKEPTLNWLTKAASASIGKKAVMAITGLALCGFLLAHLGGNLLLYVGATKYNDYAHALHAQVALLLVAEIGLLVMFVSHLCLAFSTWRDNKRARPIGYAMKQTKQESGPFAAPASSVMGITGLVVLLFIILHLIDFKFMLRGTAPKGELEFNKAIRLLKDPLSFGVYIVGSIVLGYHCLHGFQSAFQSLGLNHPKYTPTIKKLSVIFAIVVAVGFASFPIWAIMQPSQ